MLLSSTRTYKERARGVKVPTSRTSLRLRSQWIFFLPLLIIGPALIVAGWLVEDSPYVSDLLLQLGSTLILLIPLFALERGLAGRIQNISAEVARLQLKFVGQVRPELEDQLNDEIVRFREYVASAGAWLPEGPPRVRIAPEQGDYVDLEGNEIVTGPTALDDRDLLLHAYAHHILRSYDNYERLHDSFAAKAVEAGLADYLTAAFKDRPMLGLIAVRRKRNQRGSIRNLANEREFSEIDVSMIGVSDYDHDAGEIWGGAFWELGGKVGRVPIARLLLGAWERFDCPTSTTLAVEFAREVLKTSPSKEGDLVKTVFDRRGLVI
jgi:hypothetical protein